MTLTDIQKALRAKKLADVIVTGFVESGVVPVCFHALWHAVYLECDGEVLELATIGDSGRIGLSIVKAPRHTAVLDDDMLQAFTSVRQQVLLDPDGANEIRVLQMWNAVEDSRGVRCDAACIVLANGQRLFFDPSNYFGIRLGGHEQQRAWDENWPEPERRQTEVSLHVEG